MDKVLDFVFGSASIVICFFLIIQAIEYFLSKKTQNVAGDVVDLAVEKRRREVVEQIKEVEEKIIDKTKAYENKKEELYETIKRRNDSGPNDA